MFFSNINREFHTLTQFYKTTHLKKIVIFGKKILKKFSSDIIKISIKLENKKV
ncbi:hypothetical protein ABED_0499 [Aliarcobacter butzleri ED-1]|nr:hypothetical protein ABED_0499 [Aliarcobacter butzleri ED-1]